MTKSRAWIKSHAYKAPASHIHKNGTYETNLLKASTVLTDIQDTFLCPDEDEKVFCIDCWKGYRSETSFIFLLRNTGIVLVLFYIDPIVHYAPEF